MLEEDASSTSASAARRLPITQKMINGYNISTMQVRKQGAGVVLCSTPRDHPTLPGNTEVKKSFSPSYCMKNPFSK